MSIIIRIGVAGFAFIASVVTIYDNACKYAVNCPGTPETQSLATPKPEVFVCNGRLTKHANGVLTCEVGQNAGTATAPDVMPARPVETKQKLPAKAPSQNLSPRGRAGIAKPELERSRLAKTP